MLKANPKSVLLAICSGTILLLAAAWSSGSQAEICELTQAGQEHCTIHNSAVFFLLETVKFVDGSANVFTTIATIAIALFTWTLWQSNEEMGRLTKGIADIQEKQLPITAPFESALF
jgi:hypothetical protein